MRTLGIDSGSTTTKGVLMEDGKLIKHMLLPTTAKPAESIREIYNTLYSSPVDKLVSTGYGRDLIKEADKKVTEITCHAKGAAWLRQNIRAVIDIGGQDCKAILLDNDHQVVDFLMNDKCAAGTGRFIEMMMRTLEVPLEDIDAFVKGKNPANITSMCTVFAESEIVSLLAEGIEPGDIALGMIHAICRRTAYFARKMKLGGDIFFSGGLARYEIFRRTLEEYLQFPVHTHDLSQYAGAIGAALIAMR